MMHRGVSHRRLIYLCLYLIFYYIESSAYAEVCGPPRSAQNKNLDPALMKLNHGFHHLIRTQVDRVKNELGPIVLFENHVLKLIKKGQVVVEEEVTPTLIVQQVKAYNRMCMTAVIQLLAIRDHIQQKKWAQQFIQDVDAAQSIASQLGFPSNIAARQIAMSSLTFSLLNEAQSKVITHLRLKAYLQEIRPLMMSNYRVALVDHIKQLDMAMDQITTYLSSEDLENIQTVVQGSGNIIDQRLENQYLATLMGTSSVVKYDHLSHTKDMETPQQTFKLIAEYSVEVALMAIFFGNSDGLYDGLLSTMIKELLNDPSRKKWTRQLGHKILSAYFSTDLEFLIKVQKRLKR